MPDTRRVVSLVPALNRAANAAAAAAAGSLEPPAVRQRILDAEAAATRAALDTRAASAAELSARLREMVTLLADEDVGEYVREVAAACLADAEALGSASPS